MILTLHRAIVLTVKPINIQMLKNQLIIIAALLAVALRIR